MLKIHHDGSQYHATVTQYPTITGSARTKQLAVSKLENALIDQEFVKWAEGRLDRFGNPLPLIDDDYPDLQDRFFEELGV